MPRLTAIALLLPFVVAVAPSAPASADTVGAPALTYEAEQNILFVATCVGALWPEGLPVAAAGDAVPEGAVRYLDAHFFLEAQSRSYPSLAPEIDAQIEAVPGWLAEERVSDPQTAGELVSECGIFLDDWLPARAFGA